MKAEKSSVALHKDALQTSKRRITRISISRRSRIRYILEIMTLCQDSFIR